MKPSNSANTSVKAKITVTVAKTAGFCFGVDRAVKMVYNEVSKGTPTVTLGEIIHNADVVADLESKGVQVVSSPTEVHSGETVVIRSHGTGSVAYRYLEENGIPYADGTCPFVRRIQNIAAKKSSEDCQVVIIGDEGHPEVQGIAGHCKNEAVILPNADALDEYLKTFFEKHKKTVAIMPQTTYNINSWLKCKAVAESYSGIETFDTICSTTRERQDEARRLAEDSDVMIVVGGKKSANTKRLFDICSAECGHCFLVENANELKMLKMPSGFSYKGDIRIGITAGASTPAHIIKEVKNQMSEKIIMDEDFNFEEAIDASFKKIYTGNRVKGIVTEIHNNEISVDVGTKHTGYVSLDNLTDDPNLKPADIVKIGDEIDLIVLKVNDAEGTVQLSKKKVDAQKDFDDMVKAKEDGTILEGVVTNVVKGGVLALSKGIKVFIPTSQATMRRDEKLEDLVKKTVRFKVIEADEVKHKALGSIKSVLIEEKNAAKAKFWETAAVGDVFKGEVKSITSYGAFVDLGGIDGMVHISELSWDRIKHPSEVVSVGDVLEVYIKDLDKDAGRISLGYKKDEDNPWTKFLAEYSAGDVVTGKVVSITPFGAFVQIIPGIDGLVHISQISDKRVTNVKDVLSVGDEVTAKITDIDAEKQRTSMSIKELIKEGAVDDAADDESAE
ncbi:MAG: bifunctional 4-hydroxy-3-methylbut-2-enyl diphosphate reductase/30S ribosomal protein S1 [Oscillospiraceae bacterium]|nr:bifunctional 4-hydroxy-3-methylbut-2-enyl diphosphate reductase/30S ribosomal protein S1 [Oscillospiraceae bacterium]